MEQGILPRVAAIWMPVAGKVCGGTGNAGVRDRLPGSPAGIALPGLLRVEPLRPDAVEVVGEGADLAAQFERPRPFPRDSVDPVERPEDVAGDRAGAVAVAAVI